MHYGQYNIQQTIMAACNTGNKKVSASPLSCIIMPGYSMPPVVAEQKGDKFLKRLLKTLSHKEIIELLKGMGD